MLAGAPKRRHRLQFCSEIFGNSHKTSTFVEGFYLESFPLYGTYFDMQLTISTHNILLDDLQELVAMAESLNSSVNGTVGEVQEMVERGEQLLQRASELTEAI